MHPNAHGWSPWFSVVHVARSLRRAPAFSSVVTGVLAIGIAGATVVYSAAGALLFRAIPYSDPDTLCLVSMAFSGGADEVSTTVFHWDLFEQLAGRHSGPLQIVAAYSNRGANLGGDRWSEHYQVGAVTPSFLGVIGVQPSVGRGFIEGDFRSGRHHVALLSHALWQARFAGAVDVVGKTITIDEVPYAVVGVLPAAFRSFDELETGSPAAWFNTRLGVLIPLLGDPTQTRPANSSATQTLRIVTRLRDVRELAAARRDVSALGSRLRWAPSPMKVGYTLSPIAGALNPGVPARMALLGAAVAMLLLLACANATLLMLERRESRRREMEIRAALGATWRQFVAEAVVEAVLLGTTAAVLGVLGAWEGIAVARTAGGAQLTGLAAMQLGWRGVLVAFAMSLTTALAASLGSCFRLLRSGGIPWQPLDGGSPSPSPAGFLPSSIVVVQVGLSICLLVVGGMLARDFARQAAVDIGYQTENVLTARMALSSARHADGGRQFFDRLLEHLRNVPGVEDAALVFPPPGVPMAGALGGRVEGYGDEALGWCVVSRSYFSLLRIPILAGRGFTDAEVRGAEPVVVVNNAFAERYWGSARSAVGRHIGIGIRTDGAAGAPVTVIGVARDVPNAFLMTQPEMYTAYSWAIQRHLPRVEMCLLIRSADGALPGLAKRLNHLVEEVDAYQPPYGVRALEDLVASALVRTRLLLMVVGVFSVLATLLATIGVYVVLAFAVARRTREFGIRLALGASRREVLQQVLGRSLALVGSGVALTLPVTYGAIWLFAAELFGVSDTDPTTCLWAVGIIGVAALLASLVPAWRAIRVHPSIALRQE